MKIVYLLILLILTYCGVVKKSKKEKKVIIRF